MNSFRLSSLVLIAGFFPYVGFFPGTDIQPTFFLFVLAQMVLRSKTVRFEYWYLQFSLLIIIVSVIWLDIEFIVNTAVLALTLSVSSGFSKRISKNHVFYVTAIYVVVGLIQFHDPLFFSGFLNRSNDLVLAASNSGRGVRSLTAEPSDLSRVFLLFNILYLSVGGDKKGTFWFFLCNLFLSQSLYGVTIHFLFLFFQLKWRNRIGFLVTMTAVKNFTINFGHNFGFRLVKLLTWIFDEPELLLTQGAFKRLMNVPSTLSSLLHFGLLGSAGGDYSIGIAALWTPLGDFFVPIKSRYYGGLLEFLLRYGLFGIPLMLHVLFPFKWIRKTSKGMLLWIILIGVQDGQLVNPLYWLTYFKVLTYVRNSL